LTPANAMLAVELVNLADMLDSAGGSRYANITGPARSLSSRIRDAVWSHGVSVEYLSFFVLWGHFVDCDIGC